MHGTQDFLQRKIAKTVQSYVNSFAAIRAKSSEYEVSTGRFMAMKQTFWYGCYSTVDSKAGEEQCLRKVGETLIGTLHPPGASPWIETSVSASRAPTPGLIA